MDEIDKLRVKNAALIAARNYLLNQTPSDPVVIAQVTENIVDLAERALAAGQVADIPQVSVDEQQQLAQAVGALRESIESNAATREIIEHAKGVFDLVPWPPEGFKIELPEDTVSWPPRSMVIKPWPPGSE